MTMKWISVDQELPRYAQCVLVAGGKKYGREMFVAYRIQDEWLLPSCSDVVNIYPPKFWMPLPAPPEGQ